MMHLRSSLLSVFGCAAFTVLAGCASTPPVKDSPMPSSPPPPAAQAEGSPWQHARVGDSVAYTFSANRTGVRPSTQEARIAGRLALEVVAVQAPWVWLKLSFSDEAGKPMTAPMMARPLVVPVSMEASRPLELKHEGTPSAEQPSAAGRTWQAQRFLHDSRPSDGPLEDRLYAVSPGPLYLTHGLLSASTTLSGFGMGGGTQLTLVEVKQGPAPASAATPPALQYPLGPGTFSDFSMNMSGSEDSTQRRCVSAEQGFLLEVSGPVPAAGSPACPSFAQAEPMPLEEALLGFISQNTGTLAWPPSQAVPAVRNTLSVKGRPVASFTYETPEVDGTTKQVRYETFAADPWDASLDMLDVAARFAPLADGVDRVEAKGQRKPVAAHKLVGWGSWLAGGK